MALLGGVGGTLTVLCYGYWIREHGRAGPGALSVTRLDLAAGYGVTALFGLAMVLIGSQVPTDGGGARLIVNLADGLEARWSGPGAALARWAFLLGAWSAVFSSLMGVWQSVPYLFADFWRLTRGLPGRKPLTESVPYRVYRLALAAVPAVGLMMKFEAAQKAYAVFGALFIPLLALALLLLGRRPELSRLRNGPLTTALLVAALGIFAVAGVLGALRKLGL